MLSNARRPILEYGVAMLAVCAALLVRWLLGPLLEEHRPLLTLYAAVAVAVWFGGLRPAVLATAVGYLAADYLFIEPRGVLGFKGPGQVAGLALYLVSCAIIIALGVGLRAALRKAEAVARDARDRQERLEWEAGERRKAEAGLCEQAELLDLAHDAIMARTPDGAITFWSRGAEALYGWTSEEAVGRVSHDLLRTQFPRPQAEIAADLVRDGWWEGHLTQTRRDGSHVVVASRWALRRDGPDQPAVVLEINDDVTAEWSAREAVWARQRQLQLVADHAPVLIAHCDSDRRFRFVNKPYAARFGLHPRDIIGKTIVEVLGEQAYASIRPYVDAALAGKRVEYELAIPYRDIGVRYMHCAYEPERGQSGQVVGYVAALLDITERKRAEQQLEEEVRITETLHRIGGALAAELDLRQLVQKLTDETTRLTDAAFGAFFYNRTDARGESYALYTLSGAPRAAFEHVRMPRNTALFEPTYRGTGAVRLDDVTRDPRYGNNAPYHGLPEGHLPVRSYLAVPVVSRSGEVLGGLLYGHPDAGVFTERHERIIVGVAAQAAIAIDNARLYQRVQESEQRFRVTLASIGDAVIAADTQGRVTFLNSVAESLTGWRKGEAEGQPIGTVFQIINEQTRKAVEAPVEKVLREGQTVGLANHSVLVARGGTERPVDDSAAPIRDESGQLIGVVLVFRDVTERRRAEHARAQLSAIVESSQDAIISKDLDGIITSWNEGAKELYGYTAEEVVGRPISLLIPPEQPDELLGIMERLRRGERVEHYETVRVRKDGSRVDVSVSISPVRNAEGRVVGASAVARDITDRQRAEHSVRESEERLRLALDAGRMGVWDWNIRTNEVRWSDNLEPIHGLAPGTFGGTFEAFRRLIHPDDRAAVEQAIARSLEERSAYDIEFRNVWPDGSVHWMAGKGRVFCDSQGEPLRMIGVGMDITGRKHLEEELRRHAEELADAHRRKDEFLATLAHELRNPLAPIRNAVELLRRTGGGAVAEQARAVMERQMAQMVRLIDDLLDISRITRNKLELRRQRIDLATVVQSAVETSRPLIEASGHELTVALPPGPVYLDGDLTRLAQVFANLLTNAAKYTDRGGHIWLLAERQGDEVVVSVKDNGIGIPAEHLPGLFEMFSQVTSALERSQGGLGIGLALVKGLVAMHGGSIKARSAGPGQGSEFIVRLPVLPDATSPEPAPARADTGKTRPRSRRILVVDDLRDSAESLAIVLRLMGHETHTAHDGLEAVEAAAWFRPDVILLDIGLPKLNGYEAARRIREQAGNRAMVLVALTGWGQEEDKRRATEAGFDLHMTKPMDPATLEQLLAGLEA